MSSLLSFSPVSAKTILTDIPRSDWAKYGINPLKVDTDNDGFTDSEEIRNGFCPTSADSIALTDKNCRKGRFNSYSQIYTPPLGAHFITPRAIKKFSSCSDLERIVSASNTTSDYDYGLPVPMMMNREVASVSGLSSPAPVATAKSADYSSTNIQVQGVDEGDIIKTDGTYIYNIIGSDLVISQAVPAEQARVLSRTPLGTLMNPREIYIEGNKVLVLGYTNSRLSYYDVQPAATKISGSASSIMPMPYPYFNQSRVMALTLDVTDRTNPEVMRSLEFSGTLAASRVTNGYAYLVVNNYTPRFYPMRGATKDFSTLPTYRDLKTEQQISELLEDGSSQPFTNLTPCTDVDYIAPARTGGFMQVVAIPLSQPLNPIGKKVLWGVNNGSTVYVSPENVYVASRDYSPTRGNSNERTELYKFKFNKNTISLTASQSIPGVPLNQFSLDENGGLLRIAVTESQARYQFSAIYIYDSELQYIGAVKDIAPGEQIYSTRFMGNRAYMVTFRQTDPFYVIDLKDPRNPAILGELKIPGFSNYLHPYDENHIIGIGKATVETDRNGREIVLQQGVKLGLFDVTNPSNPRELFKTEIGDRGTDSPALNDHHAFLFSKDKNLLAFPINIVSLTPEQKASSTDIWAYGKNTFQGLMVYNLNLQNGFQELGRITHAVSSTPTDYWYGNYGLESIKRSLYIGNNLYTVSDKQMMIHKLFDLAQIGLVKF